MKSVSLVTREYTTVNYVSGPLIFVEKVRGASFGEIVRIFLPGGEERTGQVLDISEDLAIVQVFEGTRSIDNKDTKVRFTGQPARLQFPRICLVVYSMVSGNHGMVGLRSFPRPILISPGCR